MATIMDILNDMTKKSKAELRTLVDNLAVEALKGMHSYDIKDACCTILTAVLATVSADGYFSSEEFYVAQPVIEALCGDGFTYEQTLDMIRGCGADYKEVQNMLDALIDSLDADTKAALFLICGALCAADKQLNAAELRWLDKLAG